MKYKQCIHLEGKCIEDIFYLPCVISVTKTKKGLSYFISTDGTHRSHAYQGQWLCEDYDGRWHIESFNDTSIKGNRSISVPIEQYDLDNNLLNVFPSLKEASRRTGVCITSIRYCTKGKVKKAGKYIWKIKTD